MSSSSPFAAESFFMMACIFLSRKSLLNVQLFFYFLQRDDKDWHKRVIEVFSDNLNGFPVLDIGKYVATETEEIGFQVGPVCFS